MLNSSAINSKELAVEQVNKSLGQCHLAYLESLLRQKKFREADFQTWRAMLYYGDKEQRVYVDYEGRYYEYESGLLEYVDIDNFDCSALGNLDRIWVEYSRSEKYPEGQFGFSVQKKIWENEGGSPNASIEIYRRFAIKVGWKIGDETTPEGYLFSDDLTFNTTAPTGHLPGWGGGYTPNYPPRKSNLLEGVRGVREGTFVVDNSILGLPELRQYDSASKDPRWEWARREFWVMERVLLFSRCDLPSLTYKGDSGL